MKRLEREDSPFSGEHQLYTLIEVAKMLKISRMTIYRLVHERKIPHIRVGDTYRITQATLNRWTRGEFDHLFSRRYKGPK